MNNALALLHDDELCITKLKIGRTLEVRWNKACECFLRTDKEKPTAVTLELVEEWWPASVKF
jgi:hypothetical protein